MIVLAGSSLPNLLWQYHFRNPAANLTLPFCLCLAVWSGPNLLLKKHLENLKHCRLLLLAMLMKINTCSLVSTAVVLSMLCYPVLCFNDQNTSVTHCILCIRYDEEVALWPISYWFNFVFLALLSLVPRPLPLFVLWFVIHVLYWT